MIMMTVVSSGNISVGISCVNKLHVALPVVSSLGYSSVYFVVASDRQQRSLV